MLFPIFTSSPPLGFNPSISADPAGLIAATTRHDVLLKDLGWSLKVDYKHKVLFNLPQSESRPALVPFATFPLS